MNQVRRIELDGKIWTDARGWGLNPLETAGLSGKPVYHFHTVSMHPGALRGSHSHEGATEWLLVCGGPAKLVWRTGPQASVHEFVIGKDAPTLFEIPPRVEHAVLNTSRTEVILVSFSDSPQRETLACPSLFPAL